MTARFATMNHVMRRRTTALAATLFCLATGCSPAVRLHRSEDVRAAAPPRIQTSAGELAPAQSHAILDAMAREAGASEILLHHVAVEEAYTGSPLVMGNRVTLLRDGPATYRSMEEAIRSARHHVNLEVYTFQDDALGARIAELLAARAREGIEVNVLYDGVGCIGTRQEFFDWMREAGIRTVEFNPVSPASARGDWRVEHRDHRKLLVVDNRIAFTGGINISTEYSGAISSSGRFKWSSSRGSASSGKAAKSAAELPWRDTQVRIEGPVVAEFQKLFRASWEKQHGAPIDWTRYFEPAAPVGNQIVRAIGSTPDDSVSVIHTTMLSAIQRAERSVHLTQAYFVPDRELVKTIAGAARRGVDVQLILPGESGFWMTRYGGRWYFAELLEAGVRIFERRGPLLHAKTLAVDGVWSTVGSTNFDYRSLVKNDEVNAVILGEVFTDELEAMFAEDRAASTEITRESWKKRGLPARAKELVAHAWKRWL
jgi:cardiolipin synthase A/B